MAKASQKGLGKGLGALFAEPVEVNPSREEPKTLPIQKIEPNRSQPRQEFDEEALLELSDSIREHGLIQPITVRPLAGGYYQIIAGERRWRASRMAELKEVPVTILDCDDKTAAELALIENLQREDLSPLEEAQGYGRLLEEYGMTQEDVAKSVGKSRPAVTNALRLLKLPESITVLLREGSLSAGHARALLSLETEEQQKEAAGKIVNLRLSVRQTEALVKKMLKPQPEEPVKDILAVDYYKECEKSLSKTLGRKVTIQKGKRKGKFELEFYGDEDLQQLIDLLETLSRK